MLIGLVEPLSINKSSENAIKKRHLGTYARQNNVALILPTLLVLWNKLPRMFNGYRALLEIYQDYCWNI